MRLDQGGTSRRFTLWDALRAPVQVGAICSGWKQAATSRPAPAATNLPISLNFRGFPHIPGEDWLSAYPKAEQPNTGGAMAVIMRDPVALANESWLGTPLSPPAPVCAECGGRLP